MKYCRQDAIRLTGITSSRLAYFDRMGLISPEKLGQSKKPVVLFSPEDLELLKALDKLCQWFSLEALRSFTKGEEPLKTAMLNFLQAMMDNPDRPY